MKKLTIYGCMGAIALCTMAGFTACSPDATDGGTQTQDNGERSVVKTQFAINIPYAGNSSSTSNAKTRMSDTNTQNKDEGNYKNFRGIQDLALLCFDGKPSTTNTEKGYSSTATKVIYLSSGDNAYSKDKARALYRDVEIPTGTSYFIMNGRAAKASGQTEFEVGSIKPSDTDGTKKSLSEINYSLNAIAGQANFANNDSAKAIITMLNKVANSEAEYKVTEDSKEKTYTVKWSEASNKEVVWPSTISTQERDFLAKRYKQFTSLEAGSQASVIFTLQNLQEVLLGGTTEGSTIPTGKAIQSAIYENCKQAITRLSKNTFPQDLKLPDGVARLKWVNSAFAYESSSTSVEIGKGNNIDYTKVCYPAEISYTISTPAMVSESDISNVSQLPDYTKWISNETGIWSGWSQEAVNTRTRSVALKLPVQYGVACLKTTVKCKTAKLEDNRAEIVKKTDEKSTEENQQIDVPTDGYPLTAILVGGQPAKVNWDFYPASDEKFANTVYDHDMNGEQTTGEKSIAVKYWENSSETSTPNYTLLLDNKNTTSGGQQSSVYVTLEFKNIGKSFYGADGLVPNGARFYLVGLLSAEKFSEQIDHAFLQDHTTVANFTIQNLQKAYNCIPDLRTAGLNVGLAVNLEWQEGLTFNVDL